MKKKTIILLTAIVLLTGCKEVKLDNGENAIVTFKEGGLSSTDLYNELKSVYGAEKVMDIIDRYLLNNLYEETDEENEYIEENLQKAKDSAEEMDANLSLYLKYYYGVPNEKTYKEYLRLNYRRDLYKVDYAKEIVSDKQIDEYYESEIYGDVEASHILITYDVSDEATDEEKEEAENKALETVKEIIDKLNNGEDFAELAKEYSKDETTKDEGGSLGKVNDGDTEEEVLNALRDMSDGEYTKEAIKSSLGYHILYKKSQEDKPELDEVKEKIIETVGKEMSEEDGFQIKALKALREKNEMNFEDTELGEDFDEYITRLESQYNN